MATPLGAALKGERMKLRLTTEYTKVDADWLRWWIEECGPNYGVTDVKDRPIFPFELTSKDPSSPVMATTRVELVEEAE